MVGRWGMSAAIGPVAVIPRDGAGPFLPGGRRGLAGHAESSSTRRCAASSTRRTSRSSRCSEENRDKLDSLASALLEHETLDEDDAYAAAGVPRAETATADSYAAAARSRIDR